jgi:hypothetical protein
MDLRAHARQTANVAQRQGVWVWFWALPEQERRGDGDRVRWGLCGL